MSQYKFQKKIMYLFYSVYFLLIDRKLFNKKNKQYSEDDVYPLF